ncbi:MmgE/PrpD family protein [Streptomyces canus]|uniref:MmgE/PrpD family protein n=1 Tax=Streptomyces canus TaxID=58343 RepID=UPI0003674E11|nr:MmgE/PrpD family protein [Streptomyces canus]
MTRETLAEQVAAFAVRVRDAGHDPEVLPAEVVASVRMRVLDVLGIAVAASALETSASARAYVAEQGGRGVASAIGVPEMLSAPLAAFVNGVLAHSLDYDDTHLPSVLHPSASVVPGALAVAEATAATGRQLVAAIAVGLETTVRLGMAGYDREAQNSMFFEHGQHATSICGTMGSAVAAALLLGLDERGVADTLGVAASMGSGVIEANRTGGTVKRMHCGWAAHSGVVAAQLVRHGFTGPPTVLEGRFGFLRAWLHGRSFPDEVSAGLGRTWSLPEIFFKPYPANHFTHAGIDAALTLRARGLDPAEIESIELRVPRQNLPTIGEPIEVKRAPQTGYMAQFSGPYTVVAGLLGGGGLGVGLEDFTDELAQDPARRELMAKVDVVADPTCTAIFPAQFPAILRVRTRGGKEWAEEVLANRGGPQRPLSFAELALKFRQNASLGLDDDALEFVERTVAALEGLDDVRPLLSSLRTLAKTTEEKS